MIPIQLPINAPVGAGFKRVNEDDPLLRRNPLIIVGSLYMSADTIYQKFLDYRIWHTLKSTSIESARMLVEGKSSYSDIVQQLFQQCESNDASYAEGVDSVGIIYCRADESKVIKQLSGFTPSLSLVSSALGVDGQTLSYKLPERKSLYVQSRNGTKRLAVLEQCLNIEVQKPTVFFYLNNPSDPSWMTVAPEKGPLMYAYVSQNPSWLTETQYSEIAAWDKVKAWLRSADISIQQEQQYPEGDNAFPDFRARLGNQEYDIEMTSVPELDKWTIRGNFRDLEKKICQVAKQPSESEKLVIDKLHQVVDSKAKKASTSLRRFVLVVSNWSTYELSYESRWPTSLNQIDVVFLIDVNKVHCLKWSFD